MRYAIPFRGVGIPAIRETLVEWRTDWGLHERSPSEQLLTASTLFEGEYTEDKLSGILYMQDNLLDTVRWKTLVACISGIFGKKLIFDWNTCDWLCVRILGPLIDLHGMECARRIGSWSSARYLWKARAAVVPFVKVAGQKKYHPVIRAACTNLIGRDERFAKTSVGWVLRDVSRSNLAMVRSFVRSHIGDFTTETIRNAISYMPLKDRQKLLTTYKRISA